MRYHPFLLAVLFHLGSSFAASIPSPNNSSQATCPKYLEAAKVAADNLQKSYFNGKDYGGQAVWISAVDAFYLQKLDSLQGTEDYATVIDTVFDSNRDYLDNGKSYDDVAWVSIAYLQYGDQQNAIKYYNISSEGKDDACHGGLWWDGDKTFKNAITNELYMTTSGLLYAATSEENYLANLNDTWQWLRGSKMQGENGLFNDGLTKETCNNNGGTTWTYNQAALLVGLAHLTKLGDTAAADAATKIVNSVMQNLTEDGVLKEPCENSTSISCNSDQQVFKSINMFFLAWYLDIAGAEDAKFSDFIKKNADAVIANAGNDGVYGPTWINNTNGAQSIDASQASALGALLAAGGRAC